MQHLPQHAGPFQVTIKQWSHSKLQNYSSSVLQWKQMSWKQQKKICYEKWLHSYLDDTEPSKPNTNSSKVYDVFNPVNEESENHAAQMWWGAEKVKNCKLFWESDIYKDFKQQYQENGICYKIFSESVCICTKNPTFQSCNDPIMSTVKQYMAATLQAIDQLKNFLISLKPIWWRHGLWRIKASS